MSTIPENAKAIFLEAVEQQTPEAWPEFLDQACDDDRDLRGMVEGLLLAHVEKDSLFDRVGETQDYQPLVRPGQAIGHYKIREQIAADIGRHLTDEPVEAGGNAKKRIGRP